MLAAMQLVPESYLKFKWNQFRKISSPCWEKVDATSAGLVVSKLTDEWCSYFFDGIVARVSTLSRPGGSLLAVVFRLVSAVYDVRLFSQVRAGDYYDFFWDFGDGGLGNNRGGTAGLIPIDPGGLLRRTIPIQRLGAQGPSGSANAIWRIDPQSLNGPPASQARLIRVYCADLDETIDINLDTLAIQVKESQVSKAVSLAPWHRVLMWMWQLRSADAAAFKRLPAQLKTYLSGIGQPAQLEALTEASIRTWQSQKLLPQDLPWFVEGDVLAARGCITRQQGIARSTDVLRAYNNCNPIPKILHGLDPGRLGPLDLQSLIVIGALQEMHGFMEVERSRIIARRPDLQALLATPQGARRIEQDGEIMGLNARPEAAQGIQDQADIMMRRAGNLGPTGREMQMAMEQQMHAQMQMTSLQAISMGDPFTGILSAMETERLKPQAGPAWKVYYPYLC